MKIILSISFLLLSFIAFSQKNISREQAYADIDSLQAIMMEVHYNPFLFIKESDFHSKTTSLKKTIKDSISLKDFTLLLYKVTALLKDGHTCPAFSQPQFSDDRKREIFFPYSVVVQNGSIYIPKTTSMMSGIPAGVRITAINGRDISGLAANMDKFIGGNAPYARELATKLFPYFLYLNDLTAPFTVSYTDDKNKGTKTIEKGLNYRNALAVTLPGILKSYDFDILNNKLGYLDFRSMNGNLNEVDKYFDSCITLLKTKNINTLAIDLRKNTGGDSKFGDLLISYFYTGNYALMGGRKWKISQRYKDHIGSKGNPNYLEKENGTILESGDCKPHKPKFINDNVYGGKVYLITGPLTFSSANMIADGVKHYKICEIIGEPTGENTNDFGEVITFTLPNSKLVIQTTTSYDIGADCNSNIQQPVMPDILLKATLTDKINERDVVLDYLLKQIK